MALGKGHNPRLAKSRMFGETNSRGQWIIAEAKLESSLCIEITDLNTWIAGSHGFAYSSMRATENPSAAILLQSKHWIDTPTSAHVSAWNATGDRFLASNFMKILKKKGKVTQIFKTLKYLLKIAKKIADVN